MSRIVVPLDGMNRNQALALAETLSGAVWGFKVNDLLVEEGISILRELKRYGNLFADPKLHDIPNTVANSVSKLDTIPCDLITIHASGGKKMIEAAVKAATHSKILCVTALTSLAESDTKRIFGRTPKETVVEFATIAAEAGAYGIVCSPEELTVLNQHPELANLKRIVPGIRPAWYGKADDQVRIATPKVAAESGATLLVIGRPITEAENPVDACKKINAEIG